MPQIIFFLYYMQMLEIHTKLAQAEEQIRAGQVRPAEDALQELAEK